MNNRAAPGSVRALTFRGVEFSRVFANVLKAGARTLPGAALLFYLVPATLVAAVPDLRDRIGFYQWRGVSAGDEDLLEQAGKATTRTGARVFRFYLGARFDYRRPVLSPKRFDSDEVQGPLTLAKIINLPRYRAVLDDRALSTIILTAYPVVDSGGGPDDLNLLHPWGPDFEKIEREQITALCGWLYENFGDTQKTIIIANHEADEKLMDIANYTGSPETAVDTMIRWTNTRFAAIDAVRKSHPAAKLRIFHAFEIALVNMRIQEHRGAFRKAASFSPNAKGISALRDVVPKISFDLISYSSYESINSPSETQDTNRPPAETGERLTRDLDRIRAVAQPRVSEMGRKTFGKNFVLIGELGFARDRFEQLPAGGILPRLYSAMRAAISWGSPYVVLWQVTDHPRSGGDAWGFGMVDKDGNNPRLKADSGCDSIRRCVTELFNHGFEGWARENGY